MIPWASRSPRFTVTAAAVMFSTWIRTSSSGPL